MSEPNENDDDLFAYEFLAANNYYRRLHGVPELQINHELSEMAQRWAEKLAEIRHLEYFQMPFIGENITFFPSAMPASDMVDYWYKESRRYEYQQPGWQIGTNYFTQMVWKNSKEIGIGCATIPNLQVHNKKGQIINDSLNDHLVVVVFYRPSGNNNRAGQFEANVNKPVDSTANNCH